jgi:hypothetical protein
MAEDTFDPEETEELLDHAEENLAGVILATVAFFKDRGIPVSEWVSFVGSRFAPTWEEVKGKGARDVARLVALNSTASGGHVHSVEGNEARAELSITWPDAEDLAHFGLTRADVDPVMAVYTPIMAHIGIKFEVSRSGDIATVVLSR